MPVRVWRLARSRFARTPLDGEGARIFGGRWNLPGTALVYTSSTLALAQLELLVHVDRPDAPKDLVAIQLEIPDRVALEIIDPASLPRGWKRYPAPPRLASIGTTWAASLRTGVLRVPSAVVPREFNYLLNPAHADTALVKEVGRERLVFDERLFTRAKKTGPGKKAKKTRTRRRSRP